MKKNANRNSFMLAMAIFGTVGIFRRFLSLPSSFIALVRGIVGTAFLAAAMLLRKQKIDKSAVKACFPMLIVSGAAIGFNWILLFEAYNHTSVAVATLCYYLAPILVILASPLVLHETLTLRKRLCAAAALVGMVLVSGIAESGFAGISEMKGIFLGIGAAVLYASVILMNKKMPPIPAIDKTVFQLGFASAALLPYVLFTVPMHTLSFSALSLVLLATMGIVHTGFAYLLYFGSIRGLGAHTIALMSYIDPVLAILLSALLLREPMGIAEAIGAVLILVSAYISER